MDLSPPPIRARKIECEVTAEHAGLRLDQFLARTVPGLSRRQARTLIDIGGVFVDRRRSKMAGRPVRAGQKVVAYMGGALERARTRGDSPPASTFRLVHE